MTARRVLPARRAADSFDFEFDGARYTATFSRFPGGSVAEIFLSTGKPNSARDVTAKDGAIVLSIALQHGVPLNVIRHALQRAEGGEAASALCRALDIIEAAR
jgi:hypothetical protein